MGSHLLPKRRLNCTSLPIQFKIKLYANAIILILADTETKNTKSK